MKCVKVDYADAFLIGKGAVLGLPVEWSNVGFDYFETKYGNKVAVPHSMVGAKRFPISLYLGGFDTLGWPILPLVRHRGGFFTPTAKKYIELAYCAHSMFWWPPCFDPQGEPILRRGNGQFPRTAHRVVWADRKEGRLVFDIMWMPRAEDGSCS